MKEAAGEANITVITIVLIGAVAAVGLVVIPRLMKNAKRKSCCVNGGGVVSGKYCYWPNAKNKYLTDYCSEDGCGRLNLAGDQFNKVDSRTKDCMAN